MRIIGDELALPLIELPYQTRFVDIAKVINERISEENLDTISRALSIQQRLSRLVLEGGGFPELAEMLADQVGHSISIENDRFEAIANKNIAEVDSARRYTIEHGRTNPLLIEALAVEYLPKIRASLRPVQLPVMPAARFGDGALCWRPLLCMAISTATSGSSPMCTRSRPST